MIDRQLRLRLGLPVEVLGRDTPFGYRKTSPTTFEMDPEEFGILIEAYARHCVGDTLQNVSDFLQETYNKKISVEGLRQIFLNRPPKLAALLPEKYKTELYICLMKENLI